MLVAGDGLARISTGSLSTSARQRSAAPAADGASEPDAPLLDGCRHRGGPVAIAGGKVEPDEIGDDADPGDDVSERTVPESGERLPRRSRIALDFEDEGSGPFEELHAQPGSGPCCTQCRFGVGNRTVVERHAGDDASCHSDGRRHVHLLGEREAGLGLDERVVELAFQ